MIMFCIVFRQSTVYCDVLSVVNFSKIQRSFHLVLITVSAKKKHIYVDMVWT